jgi:hypothetical protein
MKRWGRRNNHPCWACPALSRVPRQRLAAAGASAAARHPRFTPLPLRTLSSPQLRIKSAREALIAGLLRGCPQPPAGQRLGDIMHRHRQKRSQQWDEHCSSSGGAAARGDHTKLGWRWGQRFGGSRALESSGVAMANHAGRFVHIVAKKSRQARPHAQLSQLMPGQLSTPRGARPAPVHLATRLVPPTWPMLARSLFQALPRGSILRGAWITTGIGRYT